MKARGGRAGSLVAALLLLLLVGGVIVLGTAGRRGADPFEVRRSSFLATPTGTRVLHHALDELGYVVRRNRASLRSLPPDARTLLLLSPPIPLGADEARGVVAWVEAGGTLLLTLGGGRLAPTVSDGRDGSDAGIAHELGLRVRRTPTTQYLVETLGPLGRESPSLRFQGGRVLDGDGVHFANFLPLVRNRFGTVAAEIRRGRGRAIVFADDTFLTNRLVRHPDNALLLVRLAAPADPRGAILIDERHQGYGDEGDAAARLAGALAASGVGWALLQAGLAAALLLYLSGRRFGAPLPAPRARRRSGTEAAEALGAAYRASGGSALAAETLAHAARRRAGPRFGIPYTLDPAEFSARLRGRRVPAAVRLADALDDLATVPAGGRRADSRLERAARDVERALGTGAA